MTEPSEHKSTRTLVARNPRTGEIDYRFEAPEEVLLAAIAKRLRIGQRRWRNAGAASRAAALGAFAENVRTRRAAIFEALAVDTGRCTLAVQEIDAFIAMIERWRRDGPGLLEESEAPSAVFPHIAIRHGHDPYQLVGAISPWNFPLLLAFIDALPALMAGSAVLIKPSEATPRFIAPLAEAIAATPLLCEALHIAAGDGETGAALVPLVDVIAFTGSVPTGRKVAEAAARALIPAFLELGGKDPAIVLASADIERAARAILRGSVVGTGQACQSIERVYVDEKIFAQFVARLVELAIATPLATEKGGIIGPLIFARQAEVIAAQLRDALAKGAIIHCGGVIETHGGGRWIAPTVVTNVTHQMALMTEETFGPVMPVMSFAGIDEAVRLANDTIYGLSAAVFAGTEGEALAVAERLEAGGVSINDAGLTTMVFEAEKSGFKLSGMGPSRMGASGLTRFLRRKAYYLNRGDAAPIEAFAEKD